MAFKPLSGSTGYLVVGLTPVRLTANLIGVVVQGRVFVGGAKYPAHTLFIQQHESNTGYLALCGPNGNLTTGVDILEKLIPPFLSSGSLTGLAWLAFTLPYAPGGLNASDYYLISDVAAQKAIVSAIQA